MNPRSMARVWRAAGLLTISLAGFSHCGGSETTPPAPPPNIVLVMTDDQGWAQLGQRGNPVIQTPNLDRLAAESADFTRFYVSPVCAPTRASLMTGRHHYRTGVVDTYLGRAMMHSDEVTLAEMLGKAGYRTGIFGKWHLGDNYPMRPIDQGFGQALVHKGGGIGQPADPPETGYFDPILQDNGAPKKYRGYCTDIFFDAAIRFVERNRDRPFLAYIPTNAPHSPYLVPDSYIEPYKAQGLDDKDARIYGMITNIDENVGQLLAKLDELGLADNTIVIFMTDNGPTTQHFTAGLRGQKASVYEGGIRVPFFLRWRARVEPKEIGRIAAHVDVVPTLLEAAGAAKPDGAALDGLSLMPLLSEDANGSARWPERTIHIQAHRGDQPELYRNFAAISQQYKLVQPRSFSERMPAGAPLELYDIEADPGENDNIAAQHPDLVAKMKKGYEDWFRDVSSTRGYDPPRIPLGTEHENPVTLTRQDWRVTGEDGWSDSHLGSWQVDVQSAGSYEVQLRFATQEAPGRAEFKLGSVEEQRSFTRGAESLTFGPLELEPGPGLLEARLLRGGKAVGVKYVDVTKLE